VTYIDVLLQASLAYVWSGFRGGFASISMTISSLLATKLQLTLVRLNRLLVSPASRGMRNICNIGVFIFSFDNLAQPRAGALAVKVIGYLLQKIADKCEAR